MVPVNAPKVTYAGFAPVIERFLKEHLFADIFERDVMTWDERELATIAILATIGGVEPMARSHMGICLNLASHPDNYTSCLILCPGTSVPVRQTRSGEN